MNECLFEFQKLTCSFVFHSALKENCCHSWFFFPSSDYLEALSILVVILVFYFLNANDMGVIFPLPIKKYFVQYSHFLKDKFLLDYCPKFLMSKSIIF